MVVLAAVLTGWLLLTFPAAVFMGKCIERGLSPTREPDRSETPTVPGQRSRPQGAAVQGSVPAGRTQR